MIPLHGNQRSVLMGYKKLGICINVMAGNLDHEGMFSEDLISRMGMLSRCSGNTKVLRNIGGDSRMVWKQLC
jgi:hypothetical protein